MGGSRRDTGQAKPSRAKRDHEMSGRLEQTIEILPWDWRHRIGFDISLRANVRDIASRALEDEKRIISELIDFFSCYVSIDNLLNSILSGDLEQVECLEAVEPSSILAIPKCLEKNTLEKLRKTERIVGEKLPILEDLVKHSLKSSLVVDPERAMGIVFGEKLNELIAYGKSELQRAKEISRCEDISKNSNKSSKEDAPRAAIMKYMRRIKESKKLMDWLGEIEVPSFDVTVMKGSGFAEYWPWFLTEDRTTNELILYENSDSVRKDQLYPTLNHELYPGHAYFYHQLEEICPRFVDHGAYALVEGWATWAEWNGIEEGYCAQSRLFRLEGLCTLKYDSIDDAEKLVSFIQSHGYSELNAMEGCLQFYQYPALGLSYTLGALWFERLFHTSTPRQFFSEMKSLNRGWGDFFRLW